MLQPQEVTQLKMDESIAYWKLKKLRSNTDRPTFMKHILPDMTEHRKQKQTNNEKEIKKVRK